MLNRKQINVKKIYLPFILIVFFSFFLFFYYYQAVNYFPFGDDLIHFFNAPHNLEEIKKLFLDFNQFRFLTKSIFFIYYLLPISHNFFFWHLPSFLLMTFFLLGLFWVLMTIFHFRKKLAVLLALIFVINHCNFYLIFTLAGIGDLLMLNFLIYGWLSWDCYIKNHQKKYLGLTFLIFVLSFFTKENFLILPILFFVHLFFFTKNKQKLLNKENLFLGLFFFLPAISFYLIKFKFFSISDPNYQYTLSVDLLLSNIKYFFAWLINYPYGWQMGMPLPKSPIYLCLVAIYVIFLLFMIIQSFRVKKKKAFELTLVFFCSLLPFYFLNRVLVYYLNLPYLFFLILLFLGLSEKHKKFPCLTLLKISPRFSNIISKLGLIFFIVLNFYFSFTIKKQWLEFSFVAVAEKKAQNFWFTLSNLSINQNLNLKKICLLFSRNDSLWAIANGDLAKLKYPAIEIYYAQNEKTLKAQCLLLNQLNSNFESFLFLKEDGHGFSVLK